MSKSLKKTFKDYYKNPEFKAKHKKYLLTKVACLNCHCMVSRCNMSHHKKTTKCINLGNQMKKDMLNTYISKIKQKIEKQEIIQQIRLQDLESCNEKIKHLTKLYSKLENNLKKL